MPKVELELRCKKCRSLYPATVTYTGEIESIDPEEHESRCPNCGTWNCADPEALRQAVGDSGKGESASSKPAGKR